MCSAVADQGLWQGRGDSHNYSLLVILLPVLIHSVFKQWSILIHRSFFPSLYPSISEHLYSPQVVAEN